MAVTGMAKLMRGTIQYAGETDIVANLFVKNVTMRYAENGARIKVFGGSPEASACRQSP